MMPGMMADDERKVAALIVGDGEEEHEIEETDESVGVDTAIEEMFTAFETKDKAGFKAALKSFIQLCKDEKESDSEESYDVE